MSSHCSSSGVTTSPRFLLRISRAVSLLDLSFSVWNILTWQMALSGQRKSPPRSLSHLTELWELGEILSDLLLVSTGDLR